MFNACITSLLEQNHVGCATLTLLVVPVFLNSSQLMSPLAWACKFTRLLSVASQTMHYHALWTWQNTKMFSFETNFIYLIHREGCQHFCLAPSNLWMMTYAAYITLHSTPVQNHWSVLCLKVLSYKLVFKAQKTM
jgi:hypothetical protein